MSNEIVTLVFNTPHLVDLMRRQIADIKVIDNGSTPAVENATFRLSANRFFSGGWNIWMEKSTADYVWMCNSDIVGISKEMFNYLCDLMEDSDAFAISPVFNSPHGLFRRGKRQLKSPLRPVPWIDWCCPVVNRRKFLELGGFDTLFRGYGADLDICVRARIHDCKMYVANNLEIKHLEHSTAKHTNEWSQNRLDDMNRKLWSKLRVRSWRSLTQWKIPPGAERYYRPVCENQA